jgi:hypothetical protein
MDHQFQISSDNYLHRINSKNPLCTICYPIGDNRSIKEKELLSFIRTIYNGVIITSYRDILEIDIYLPELKIGFEFNGLYWHSNEWKEKNYHSKKTNHFRDRGIRIIHIWEDDWDNRKEIVKSQIGNIFGLSNRIFARKCTVKEILDTIVVKDFLNKNHIQGSVKSVFKLGLYYEDKLVSIMIFDNFEGRRKMEDGGWNLSRFCNKVNTSVVGGASKLLNHFIKLMNPKRIISYADKDWSIGDIYQKLGFSLVSDSKPDYKYIVDSKRVHKSRYKKSRLKTNMSESSFMNEIGVNKIYDCGKLKFEILIF